MKTGDDVMKNKTEEQDPYNSFLKSCLSILYLDMIQVMKLQGSYSKYVAGTMPDQTKKGL